MNEFQPDDNNDMMQCVTCNKSSLFAPRLKILEKQKKRQISLWSKQEFFQMLLRCETLVHFYMKLR
jgi:hypothetical protein